MGLVDERSPGASRRKSSFRLLAGWIFFEDVIREILDIGSFGRCSSSSTAGSSGTARFLYPSDEG
jgi:hypothetical protein